jgi:hypothetical protein
MCNQVQFFSLSTSLRYWWKRVVAPFFLTFGTKWKWVASLKLRSLYPWGKNLVTFRMKGCVNSSAGPDILEKRKISYLCRDSNLGSSRPYRSYSTEYANPFPEYLHVFQFEHSSRPFKFVIFIVVCNYTYANEIIDEEVRKEVNKWF